MTPHPILFVLAAVLAHGCSNAPEEPTVSDPEPRADQGAPDLDYEGPPVRAVLEVMESEPPQYAVSVEVQVPTAGWELDLVDVREEGDALVVELKLTEPAADELVAQVIQTKTARAKLDREPDVVQVRVSRWQRGVQYLVPPAARLAAVLRP